MGRRRFLALPLAMPVLVGAAPMPIEEAHFPGRLYEFVWRNWELANIDRMAAVAGTEPERLLALGRSMGLPAKRTLSVDQLRRLYVTVIRQNWNLLPEAQIIQLLGWTPERFAFTLKEDDFLYIKLGSAKPECEPVRYQPPAAEERRKAAQMRAVVERAFGRSIGQPGEDLFQFVSRLAKVEAAPIRSLQSHRAPDEVDLATFSAPRLPAHFAAWMKSAMGVSFRPARSGTPRIHSQVNPGLGLPPESYQIDVSDEQVLIEGSDAHGIVRCFYDLRAAMARREGPYLAKGRRRRTALWDPRYLYSYVALYGDPLTEPDIDPIPEGYLDRLAGCGVNGVWIQAVLNTLAPSKIFTEFGRGSEIRLRNLNALVERARPFGIKVFLYLNEPRAMPPSFFEKHPGMKGSPGQGMTCICTSVPEVREWIAGSLEHVVREVPEIGGFFSITMSENLTNCFSHGGGWSGPAPRATGCPRCSRRSSWETIGELLTTFRDGVRRASGKPHVIAWDWGWSDDLARQLIPRLPKDVKFMSISEWEQPVHRGGVNARVGEYSISVVGPGPRAGRNWATARDHGISTMAKVQFNNTWEMSAVPYIPVPPLVLRHARNLSAAGIAGVMASWTCGGYPSPNLAAIERYAFEPRPTDGRILLDVASERYGPEAAAGIVDAWQHLAAAFEQFPYGVAIYTIPVQHGPANLLRLHPTGRKAAMILFPYDDLKAWCGAYPAEVVQTQFTRMADEWRVGADRFQQAVKLASPLKAAAVAEDVAIVETCYHHFRSVANQVEFYRLRQQLETGAAAAARARMRQLAEDEIRLARAQFRFARDNSMIGFEASNHYYYTPLDLVEKVLNCNQVIKELSRQ